MPRWGGFVDGRGLCHHLFMAKTVIVKLTDDIDGGDADETVQFALDGRSYEVDLSAANAAKLRDALKPYIEKGRGTSGGGRARSPRPSSPPLRGDALLPADQRREGPLPGLGEHADRSADQ